MSRLNRTLITAYDKGYRIIKGIVKYKKRKIKPGITTSGYQKFAIRNENGERAEAMVHRLVAYQKYGDKMFEEGIQVRHRDGNILNNLRNNILIGTSSQNQLDKSPEVRLRCAIKASEAIKKYDHDLIMQLHNEGLSYKKIMKKLNIKSKGTISFIINKSIVAKNGA